MRTVLLMFSISDVLWRINKKKAKQMSWVLSGGDSGDVNSKSSSVVLGLEFQSAFLFVGAARCKNWQGWVFLVLCYAGLWQVFHCLRGKADWWGITWTNLGNWSIHDGGNFSRFMQCLGILAGWIGVLIHLQKGRWEIWLLALHTSLWSILRTLANIFVLLKSLRVAFFFSLLADF